MEILLHVPSLVALVVIVFVIVKVLTSLAEAVRMSSHHNLLREYGLPHREITEMLINISEGRGALVAMQLRDYRIPMEVIKIVTGF